MLYTDTIDHSILFDVLEKRFGPGHDAVKMDDVKYFEGWTQAFQAGNIDSDPSSTYTKVKDWLLHHKLSPVTRSDLQEVLMSFEIKYHLYADDRQLLDKKTLQDLDAGRFWIENCWINSWIAFKPTTWRLQLNSNKTGLINSKRWNTNLSRLQLSTLITILIDLLIW